MNATASPPKPAIILATPINVEESRAQRLQRQQARFRDRGGIFVPTNRSTLLDILLGKASPLKKQRRSASASPSRANEEKISTDNEVSKPALRRSPRKQSQKAVDVVTDEQPPAMTDDPESQVGKPIKKASSSKSSRSRPQKKVKVAAKSRTKPKSGPPESLKVSAVEDSVVDTIAKGCSTSHQSATQKASKRTVDTSAEKSLKASTKKIILNADNDREHDVSLVKLKPKGKKVSETKLQGEVDGTKGTSTTRGRKTSTATSAAVTSSSRLKQTKKVESGYSELSEDESTCKPTKKAPTKKVKKCIPSLAKATSKTSSTQKGKGLSNLKQTAPSRLSVISEEEEEYNSEKDGPPSSQSVKVSSLKAKLVVARSAKSPEASDDDNDDEIPLVKSKSKGKVTSSQMKLQGKTDGANHRLKHAKKVESVNSELSKDDSVYKSTKSSTKKDNVACKPSKKSTAKKVKASAASIGTEKCGSSSSQKNNLEKEGMAPSESSSNAVIASSKGKKRASTSITQDSDSQPPRKRINSDTIQPDIDHSLDKKSNLGREVSLVTAKKRRRNPEDVESGVEDGVDKNTKRKKYSGQSTEILMEEDSVKPVTKRSNKTKVTKSARKGKRQSFDNATTASKKKENTSKSKPAQKKVASKSGPPTSVLQRIKDSLGAQVVDNEPDPIDFLS